MTRRPRVAAAALLVALTGALAAGAQTPQTPPPAGSPEDLEQRVRILERKLELADEQAAEKEKSRAGVTAGADGFGLKSADGSFQLRLRALVQADGRFFLDDRQQPIADTFVLRRARPIFEGTVFNFVDFRLMPDFGGGTTVIQDAYLDLRFSPALRLRAGKAKVPVGLEALLEDKDLPFVERGMPSNLAPVRDVGVQLLGEPWAGKLVYAVGVFNGTPDAATGDLDTEDAKDLAVRLFWRPFQRPGGEAPPPLGLGLGVGGSVGDQNGTVTAPGLPTYRSASLQNVFFYRGDGTAAGTTLADGARRRLAPQGWIYAGPWLAFAEWTQSSQEVARGTSRATLTHVAWQLATSWALTGERITERGVVPLRPFDLSGRGRGAVVVSLRYGQLTLDRDAFPLFADPAKAVRREANLGVSVSWLLNRGVRLMLDYQHTVFTGGASAAAGGDRPTEQAILTRFQLAF